MSFYEDTVEKFAGWASAEFKREITLDVLYAESRSPYHSHPRFFVMACMEATGSYSFPRIATALHLKDHTSVLHGLRRAHGHDGKGVALKKQPLWKKEQFKNIAIELGYQPGGICAPSLDALITIGERNLRKMLGSPVPIAQRNQQIVERYLDGEATESLMKAFRVSRSTIHNAVYVHRKVAA